jgi:hypothetical protein
MFQFSTELYIFLMVACFKLLYKRKEKTVLLRHHKTNQISHKLGRKGEVGILSSQANGGVHVTIALFKQIRSN